MAEPSFLSVPITAISNILVAIGTFALALITYLTVRQMKKQMNLMRKQVLISLSQQNPILQLEQCKINSNTIHLKIKNIGGGNAHQIGVEAEFHRAKELIKKVEKDKVWINFSYDPNPIIDEFDNKKHTIIKNGYINFISKHNKRVVVLKPNESIEVSLEPEFQLRYNAKLGETVARIVNLNDLFSILKTNNCGFVGFSFGVICKNAVEDAQRPTEIDKFVMDIQQHKDLEAAQKQHYSMDFVPLSFNDMELKMGGTGSEEYRNMKSKDNYVPED